MSHNDLRSRLSDSIYPYLLNEIQRMQIDNYLMDGKLYNPDGSELTPSSRPATLTQTIAFFFPTQQEYLAVILSPNSQLEATVSVLAPPKAARYSIVVNESNFDRALQAIHEAITSVLNDIALDEENPHI